MKKLDIIYEDKKIIVINKPSKMLCISDGRTNNTLYSEVYDYVKKKHKNNKIFIVHRLDKDTSGVVIFAKDPITKKYLQDNWNKITKREYIAILEGKLKEKKGTIKEYLLEDKTHKVYRSLNNKGEYAETSYVVMNCTNHNTVVAILIKTGKKNQIRVAFQDLHHPIVGDKKYSAKTNPINRLGLHASKITLKMPDKTLEFIAKNPKEFATYLKN